MRAVVAFCPGWGVHEPTDLDTARLLRARFLERIAASRGELVGDDGDVIVAWLERPEPALLLALDLLRDTDGRGVVGVGFGEVHHEQTALRGAEASRARRLASRAGA